MRRACQHNRLKQPECGQSKSPHLLQVSGRTQIAVRGIKILAPRRNSAVERA